jgi:hypothetical protein
VRCGIATSGFSAVPEATAVVRTAVFSSPPRLELALAHRF